MSFGTRKRKPRQLARRMEKFEASGIRRVFDLAANVKDALDLSIGQPDFDAPEPIRRAAIEAIESGFNRYTVTQGIIELRARLRQKVVQETGQEPEAVLVTSGTAGGILLALLVLIEEGDEVLIPDPYFVMYKNLVALAGGTARFLDLYPHFRLRKEQLEAAITDRTKLLILNSPANPTGIAYTREELLAIAEVAEAHDLLVLSDEIYDHFIYDFPHESLFKFYRNTLLVGGFSKTYGIPGWRLGYVAGPRDLLDPMTMVQQFSYVCPNAPAQKAALLALDLDMRPYVEAYRRKRDIIYEGLKDCYDVVKPQGAFYMFPRCPKGTDEEFVHRAIERKLLVVPGGACSRRTTHFRLSFATSEVTLHKAVTILRELAGAEARPAQPNRDR
ncbi:MAG: pyridoxal phosphate-dependent aminotransferase [Planctomycetes bacterium]|nr:pyridoxal phosphate-dependent aminotransferase [Planctomycetota bacterium]